MFDKTVIVNYLSCQINGNFRRDPNNNFFNNSTTLHRLARYSDEHLVSVCFRFRVKRPADQINASPVIPISLSLEKGGVPVLGTNFGE